MGEDNVVLHSSFLAGHLVPHLEAILQKSAVILRWEMMPFQLKVIQDWSKGREKALRLFCRFEPTHFLFA